MPAFRHDAAAVTDKDRVAEGANEGRATKLGVCHGIRGEGSSRPIPSKFPWLIMIEIESFGDRVAREDLFEALRGMAAWCVKLEVMDAHCIDFDLAYT